MIFSSLIDLLASLPQLGAYITIVVATISVILTYRAQSLGNRNAKEQVVILGKQTTLQELEALLNERRTDNQSLELKVEKQGLIIENQGKLIEQMRLDMQKLTASNQELIEENRNLLEFIAANETILVKNYALLQSMDRNDTQDRQRSRALEELPPAPSSRPLSPKDLSEIAKKGGRQGKQWGVFTVLPPPPAAPPPPDAPPSPSSSSSPSLDSTD